MDARIAVTVDFKGFGGLFRMVLEEVLVPKAGLEPARISTVDFESTASHKSLIIITNLLRTYDSYRQFRQQIAPAK